MDARDPTPGGGRARIPKDGDLPADPAATEQASATRAAVERARDAERSRWGLLLVAAVVLLVLAVAWKGRAIVAFFGG
jgi:hypothetical protein